MVQGKKQQKSWKRQLAWARSMSKYAFLISGSPKRNCERKCQGKVYGLYAWSEQLRKLKKKSSHNRHREANASMPICEPTLHGETYRFKSIILKSDGHAQNYAYREGFSRPPQTDEKSGCGNFSDFARDERSRSEKEKRQKPKLLPFHKGLEVTTFYYCQKVL